MSPPTRHHNPGWWSREGRAGVHMVATALARLLVAGSRRNEWREPGWQRRQPMSQGWRSEPRRFHGPPPRYPARRTPAIGRWMPNNRGDPRRQTEWQPQYPEWRPRHWRGSMRPRRGPPVAAIHAPRWNQEEWGKRRPRGFEPRGPLRGGPERPADDPQRKPRGGRCGGPGRSANDTQTPHKTAHAKTNGGEGGKEGSEKPRRPTIITVDTNGHERKWGRLSRTTARRVGRF